VKTLERAGRFGPLAAVGCILLGLLVSGAWRKLTLAELQARQGELTLYVHHHPVIAVVLYLAVFVAVVVACIPGPGALTMAGGLLFGTGEGGATALAACVVGSSLVFLACRTAFGDWLSARAGHRARALAGAFATRPFSLLLTLRLLPIMPYFVPTLAAALVGARLRDLMLATLVGSAPVIFTLAALGHGMRPILERGGALDADALFQTPVILPLAALAALSAASLLWRWLGGRRDAEVRRAG